MMQAALDLFRPGRTVYIPGASGESEALGVALEQDPERMTGVHVVGCPFPGINERDLAALSPSARATVFLPPAAVRQSATAGRTRVMPMAYSEIANYLRDRAAIDVAVAHVSPPDSGGHCSLGTAADFGAIAWKSAKQRVLLVNPAMPQLRWGPLLPVDGADVVVEAPGPIVTVSPPIADRVSDAIGARIAALVPDGATIQVGLGNAPAAVWRHLVGHRDLLLASGLVADGFRTLFDAGALRSDGDHCAGVILGSMDLIRFLAETGIVRMAEVTETHDRDGIATLPRFTAVNGALEVDLFGQVNLEWQDGRLVSGVGGAPDFVDGALRSKGGRAITALPATARAGTVTRIVPRLTCPVSLGRREADTIVTEHGVAEIRGTSIEERAAAMIAIAAPQHRDTLASAWDGMRNTMWQSKMEKSAP